MKEIKNVDTNYIKQLEEANEKLQALLSEKEEELEVYTSIKEALYEAIQCSFVDTLHTAFTKRLGNVPIGIATEIYEEVKNEFFNNYNNHIRTESRLIDKEKLLDEVLNELGID
jgi:hypothetical protein